MNIISFVFAVKEMRVLASEGRPRPSFLGVLEEKLKGAVGPEASKAAASGWQRSRRGSEQQLSGGHRGSL